MYLWGKFENSTRAGKLETELNIMGAIFFYVHPSIKYRFLPNEYADVYMEQV